MIKYLKSTSPKGASPEHVVSFLKALDELCDAHNLTFTLAERLQLIDVRPILPVEIYVVSRPPDGLSVMGWHDIA